MSKRILIFISVTLLFTNLLNCTNSSPLNNASETLKQQTYQEKDINKHKPGEIFLTINNQEWTEDKVSTVVEQGKDIIPFLLDTLDYSSKAGTENASCVIKKFHKEAVPYLIRRIKKKETDSIGRSDLLLLRLLEWITNTSFDYSAKSVLFQDKQIGIIIPDEGRTKLVQQWIRWWKDNKTRSPIAWYIRDLLSEIEEQRQEAITKLRVLTGQTFNFSPKTSPKEQLEAITKWVHWWEINKYKFMTAEERIMEILDKIDDEEFINQWGKIYWELLKFEDTAISPILTWFETHGYYHRQNLGEVGYAMLFRYGKSVVPYAIEHLKGKRRWLTLSKVDETWILRILSLITNKQFPYNAYEINNNYGLIEYRILPKEDKKQLVNKWEQWWNQNKSKSRLEWYIEDLKDSELKIRQGAIDKLKQIVEEDFGYDPQSPTEESINKWKDWWEKNKDLSEGDIRIRANEKAAEEGIKKLIDKDAPFFKEWEQEK